VVDTVIKEAGKVAVRIDVHHAKSPQDDRRHDGMEHMPFDFHVAIERFRKHFGVPRE
jgi:hypothetical protein